MPVQSSSRGFTLLEIIVVFSLLGVIAGIGFVTVYEYSRRQEVSQGTRDIVQQIQKVRSDSRASIKPEVCGDLTFSEYQFHNCSLSSCGSSGDFEVRAVCGGNDYFVSSVNLSLGLNIASSTDCEAFSFTLPDGSVSGEVPCEIVIERDGIAEAITIDESGNLTIQEL